MKTPTNTNGNNFPRHAVALFVLEINNADNTLHFVCMLGSVVSGCQFRDILDIKVSCQKNQGIYKMATPVLSFGKHYIYIYIKNDVLIQYSMHGNEFKLLMMMWGS